MGSSPSPPPPPDPVATSNAQSNENINAAIAQSELNDVNQITPYGSISYQETGGNWMPLLGANAGAGQILSGTPAEQATEKAHPGQIFIPQYTATTSLSPGMQALFDTTLANSQTSADTASALGKNVQEQLSQNVDLGPGATQAYLAKLNTQTMDPQWAQAQTDLNQTLADQGLTPGSEGWKYAQTQFGLNKANAYNNMYLQGQNTAVQDILAQYNEPLNALDALKSGAQVNQPGIGQLAPTAQSQIAPAQYQQQVESNYNNLTQQYDAQVAAHAQEMGGLFGLGGSLISGLGGLASDREDKTDIKKLGDKDGFGIYAYRYKDDPKSYPKVVGPMAQDVEEKRPGSTFGVGGHRVIRMTA